MAHRQRHSTSRSYFAALLLALTLPLTESSAAADDLPSQSATARTDAVSRPDLPAEPEPDQTNILRAQDLYHHALQSFNSERYRESAGALQQAYRLAPEPIFLFNLGQSFRRVNQLRDSRQSFAQFVREDPQDKNGMRRLALASLRELDFLIAQQEAARRPTWKKPWFWGLLAAGVAVVGTGLGLGLGLGLRDNTETVNLR